MRVLHIEVQRAERHRSDPSTQHDERTSAQKGAAIMPTAAQKKAAAEAAAANAAAAAATSDDSDDDAKNVVQLFVDELPEKPVTERHTWLTDILPQLDANPGKWAVFTFEDRKNPETGARARFQRVRKQLQDAGLFENTYEIEKRDTSVYMRRVAEDES